jgi:hypothetical protein
MLRAEAIDIADCRLPIADCALDKKASASQWSSDAV